MHIFVRSLLAFIVLCFSISWVFAYELSSKDQNILDTLYVKIDFIYERKPEIIGDLSSKVKKIYDTLNSDSRTYAILWDLYEYLEWKMNDWENEVGANILYTMPEEGEKHEATWLEWPHHYQYGKTYRDRLDSTWIAMTDALIASEKVNIVAYNQDEKERIIDLLEEEGVYLDNVYFYIHKFDDVWARDNMPIYVRDKEGNLVIQDWWFNGWGSDSKWWKYEYKDSDKVPSLIAKDQELPLVDINDVMINEGWSVEIDGHGTLLATRSAILNENRNPGMTQDEVENIFTQYLGVKNFIWLDGVAGLEITDMHIDGFARFYDDETMVTLSEEDLEEWSVPSHDIDTLYGAQNAKGKQYEVVTMPLTKNDVITEYGKDLGYKWSYINYYIANTVVLVPIYQDLNDEVALEIIQDLYPEREVIGIDVRNLYENGGMVHCVTQQQPVR